MKLERKAEHKHTAGKPSSRYRIGLGVLSVLVCAAVIVWFQPSVKAPDASGSVTAVNPKAEVKKRELLDFHMDSLSHGWVRYTDGMMVTQDGGVHWVAAATDTANTAPSSETTSVSDIPVSWMSGKEQNPLVIHVLAEDYKVQKSQFLTRNVGWVQLENGSKAEAPLWVTVDGGVTWHSKVTTDIAKEMDAERVRIQAAVKEASFYNEPETAQKAMEAQWTVLPEAASPGDVVLVRHREPGEVTWEGKTYKLEPFGAGYFTYLPMSLGIKAGSYPIGDSTLTIKAKKFQTQYLQVTKQMESMKQDTKRIEDDQKIIDKARSDSQGEFLFSTNFIKPIEGILTTPYGYTRYVNGKFDSSHRALDLAAKEGTPIKAANDGIVVLSEMLYLTGNSIYIDHGMGLFSQYAHMSELRVKAGDHVKQGDIIGLVGTTGFSTGPHLHFTFWAHNVPVNPDLFFDTTPFHWLPKASNALPQ
ncbi:Murein DD-endopeptidase MepM and murein hydrolase activator NlpD, contain LysM domain [Paenibacillus sp. 1_12]|uniref:M23 family metallopeptidase n=1 Tax=Paenibacillus sp. 1_12 TaxID=1566278 RepID=UPI0008F03EB7|nr:M23 family metallopeptidase [Paenibacillus sp. 1_12]SFL94582.1 Murein DD-endopeptidase MepM and murein hydrolase activator NlpD, contain LysM domain [Paenibacillus sp. 1_12]